MQIEAVKRWDGLWGGLRPRLGVLGSTWRRCSGMRCSGMRCSRGLLAAPLGRAVFGALGGLFQPEQLYGSVQSPSRAHGCCSAPRWQ